jgi:NAD(P)H-hydrate epimerase
MDRSAIEQHGIDGRDLMERAGAAAFRRLLDRWSSPRNIVVVAGAGNNGGDGYVIARLALERGMTPRVLQLGDHARLRGEAAAAAMAYAEAGGLCEPFTGLPEDAGLIVDAMLGTGLERPLTGPWAEAVCQINGARAPILAVDIPSGLHADTGCVLGAAVRADLTVTFIGLKQGMFTAAGPDHCGEIRFDALQVPAMVYAGQLLAARRLDWQKERDLLPALRQSAHKGDQGHVLVVGGAPGMSGAARLSAEAALRCGAGLVTLATHPEHAPWANLTRPELMVHAAAGADDIDGAAHRADVVAIGPGLGLGDWSRALLERVLTLERPLVVDADALSLLAAAPRRREDWVLTPHPGEAARLLGVSAADIEQDRFTAVERLQRRFGGVVVLKGAGTLIRGAGHRPTGLCSDGNPGMATAGMGDALTGVIAALIGQCMGPEQAASAGVCAHAAAADRAARGGRRGLIAGDVIRALRGTLADAEPGP